MVRRVCPCLADELLFFPFWNCSFFVCQVQHALKKSEKALDTLNKAINIDPKNPLCKFHRASVLFANEKYKVSLGARGNLEIPVAGNGDALEAECVQVTLGSSRPCRKSLGRGKHLLWQVPPSPGNCVKCFDCNKIWGQQVLFFNYYFSPTYYHEFILNY